LALLFFLSSVLANGFVDSPPLSRKKVGREKSEIRKYPCPYDTFNAALVESLRHQDQWPAPKKAQL
jgi:hypothetical protein